MIEVLEAGPLITLQDFGRAGYMSDGLAQGGAADRLALTEASALLGAPGKQGAALEIPGSVLRLRFDEDTTVALTGAPMRAEGSDGPLAWHASHPVASGQEVVLRPAGIGVYSYLSVLGGFEGGDLLGSQSAHLIAGIGRALTAGDHLAARPATRRSARRLSVSPDRFGGGGLRCLPTPQTALFPTDAVARFEATVFARDPRGNRQGIRMAMEGPGFATEGQLSLLSDFVLPGDVQMTGDGVPYILGPECQTTGGYPRIAHVIAADLPRAFQAPPGAALSFRFVSLAEARASTQSDPATEPLVRNPRDIANLSEYQLVSGVMNAKGD